MSVNGGIPVLFAAVVYNKAASLGKIDCGFLLSACGEIPII